MDNSDFLELMDEVNGRAKSNDEPWGGAWPHASESEVGGGSGWLTLVVLLVLALGVAVLVTRGWPVGMELEASGK